MAVIMCHVSNTLQISSTQPQLALISDTLGGAIPQLIAVMPSPKKADSHAKPANPRDSETVRFLNMVK